MAAAYLRARPAPTGTKRLLGFLGVLPMLARAFAARDRHLPAALCAEEAMALGVDDDELDRIFGDATRALGGAWAKFRASVASEPRPAS